MSVGPTGPTGLALPLRFRLAVDLISFLQSWLTLTDTDYLDFTIAGQWYKIPEDGVDPRRWKNTAAGELVFRGKYWTTDPAEQVKSMAKLGGALAQLMSRHPLYSIAQCVLSVPGHNNDGNSFGEQVAARVAQLRGIPLVRTGCTLGARTSAKRADSSELLGTITVSSTLPEIVVIVDDVYHTGGSMRATAFAARQAGAKIVLGIVGARTLRN
jgi:hypothetical protein